MKKKVKKLTLKDFKYGMRTWAEKWHIPAGQRDAIQTFILNYSNPPPSLGCRTKLEIERERILHSRFFSLEPKRGSEKIKGQATKLKTALDALSDETIFVLASAAPKLGEHTISLPFIEIRRELIEACATIIKHPFKQGRRINLARREFVECLAGIYEYHTNKKARSTPSGCFFELLTYGLEFHGIELDDSTKSKAIQRRNRKQRGNVCVESYKSNF